MGRPSRNQIHRPQRRNPKMPLPPHPVARSALKTPASSSGTVAPTGKGMVAFVNHFSQSQGGNAQSQNSATAKPAAAATAKPFANKGAKKPRAFGLRKR